MTENGKIFINGKIWMNGELWIKMAKIRLKRAGVKRGKSLQKNGKNHSMAKNYNYQLVT